MSMHDDWDRDKQLVRNNCAILLCAVVGVALVVAVFFLSS